MDARPANTNLVAIFGSRRQGLDGGKSMSAAEAFSVGFIGIGANQKLYASVRMRSTSGAAASALLVLIDNLRSHLLYARP